MTMVLENDNKIVLILHGKKQLRNKSSKKQDILLENQWKSISINLKWVNIPAFYSFSFEPTPCIFSNCLSSTCKMSISIKDVC